MNSISDDPSESKPQGNLSAAMQAIHARLCDMIRAAQEASPFEHVGQIWAKPVSLQAWCDIGGFALRTIKELIKHPPIRRYQCNLPGGKVVLLRVGDPGPEQDRAIAKQMDAYYRAATKEPTISKAEFGMLCGLARDWPDGWQVDIFKHAVIRWPDFMDDVRAEVEAALDGHARDDDPFASGAAQDHMLTTARRYWGREDKLSRRLYRRPFIPLLLAFWPVAVELFIDYRQHHGGGHPARIWQRWSERQFCALSTS